MRTARELSGILFILAALAGCSKDAAQDGQDKAPAHVEAHPDESDIYRVRLTAKAVERLGITTTPVERKEMQRHRTFGGEVLVPTGNTIVVSAPLPGALDNPESGSIPPPGTRIEAGQAIFSLVPLLSPERDVPTPAERVQMANARASLASAQIVAEGDVKQAEAEVEAAQIALDRARQLLQSKAGSARAVDEAQATLNVAQKKFEAARTRVDVLSSLTLETEKGKLRTLQITAPETGILNNLSATRGQTVTAGAALFEVVNLDTVWIRMPVYVGELDRIEANATATIGDLEGRSNGRPWTASRIAAPPSADPLSSSVDLYYSLLNPDGVLHPGQRVGVTVPLKDRGESLVIPWAAVLYDIHGTTWVYEQSEPQVFRRRRVLVRYTADDLAVLASGPEAGTQVVVDGAAELFGTEFEAGH